MASIITADKYTVTAKKDSLYSDIFVNFDIHPGKKDLARTLNEAAVKRTITNLLLTDFDERLYQPNLGGNLKYLLFEPADNETLSLMRNQIQSCIEKFEPRAKITTLTLETSEDEHRINVSLVFTMVNISKPITLNLILNRVR